MTIGVIIVLVIVIILVVSLIACVFYNAAKINAAQKDTETYYIVEQTNHASKHKDKAAKAEYNKYRSSPNYNSYILHKWE